MFPAGKALPQEPFALLPVLSCDMYTVHFRMSVGMASFLLFYYGNDVYFLGSKASLYHYLFIIQVSFGYQ